MGRIRIVIIPERLAEGIGIGAGRHFTELALAAFEGRLCGAREGGLTGLAADGELHPLNFPGEVVQGLTQPGLGILLDAGDEEAHAVDLFERKGYPILVGHAERDFDDPG